MTIVSLELSRFAERDSWLIFLSSPITNAAQHHQSRQATWMHWRRCKQRSAIARLQLIRRSRARISKPKFANQAAHSARTIVNKIWLCRVKFSNVFTSWRLFFCCARWTSGSTLLDFCFLLFLIHLCCLHLFYLMFPCLLYALLSCWLLATSCWKRRKDIPTILRPRPLLSILILFFVLVYWILSPNKALFDLWNFAFIQSLKSSLSSDVAQWKRWHCRVVIRVAAFAIPNLGHLLLSWPKHCAKTPISDLYKKIIHVICYLCIYNTLINIRH